jgi:hypothetical protein
LLSRDRWNKDLQNRLSTREGIDVVEELNQMGVW